MSFNFSVKVPKVSLWVKLTQCLTPSTVTPILLPDDEMFTPKSVNFESKVAVVTDV